jgi:very-short-patch-repair endonuclease
MPKGIYGEKCAIDNLVGSSSAGRRLSGDTLVDFVCLEERLIIELDGGQHCQQAARDAVRTQRLTTQGFEVLRFWDHEVLQDLDVVLQVIWDALHAPTKGGSPTQSK